MSKKRIWATLAGGALTVTAVLATTAAAQATPAPTPALRAAAQADTGQPKPTIVLVAGAFEDPSTWDGEILTLEHDGYPVIAPAVPLRGITSDAAYLTAVVRSIHGPVVLVGHSYGGILITEIAASDPEQVEALVYAAAFIPKAGETAIQLITQFPGSLFSPDSTYTVAYPGGSDTYIKPADFRALFAGDRTVSQAAVAAATQRPLESEALTEPVPASLPAGIPVYAIVASQDMAIPPAAERFMAQRAHAITTTVDSAHDLPASHPGAVTAVILRAAR